MKKIITIAGAGIAGMTAAINLAKVGFEVEIIEKCSEVGARFDRDFQFFENWNQEEDVLDALKKMNIEINFPIIPIQDGRVYDYKYHEYEFHHNEPQMYLVKRGQFQYCLDFYLKEQAVKAGVKFRFKEKAELDNVDIIATGPSYEESLVYVKGVRFKTDIDYEIRVIFDSNIAPNVYAYMVAYEKAGLICTAYTKEYNYKKSGLRYVEDAIKAFQNTGSFEMTNKIYFNNYGISPLIKAHSKIVIGEAAGFQDVNWGFGMRLAVISGYLASRSIIENKNYWDLVNKDILPYIATTTFNRFIFEKFGKLSSLLILKGLAISGDPVKVITRFYRPSLFKRCLFKFLDGYYKKRQKSNIKYKG